MKTAISAVLLDLDGTLADTAPDLAFALNAVRQEQGLTPLPYAQIRNHVSHGSYRLIQLGFGIDESQPAFAELRARLLDHYAENLVRETRLFDGMDTVLDKLDARHIPWGIVTNKPAFLTEPLLDALTLTPRAHTVVSGDSLATRKPHPEPLLEAARQTGVLPGDCIYVGDARGDVTAALAAGMKPLIAGYGYIDVDEQPSLWGAAGTIAHPREILDWLDGDAS